MYSCFCEHVSSPERFQAGISSSKLLQLLILDLMNVVFESQAFLFPMLSSNNLTPNQRAEWVLERPFCSVVVLYVFQPPMKIHINHTDLQTYFSPKDPWFVRGNKF